MSLESSWSNPSRSRSRAPGNHHRSYTPPQKYHRTPRVQTYPHAFPVYAPGYAPQYYYTAQPQHYTPQHYPAPLPPQFVQGVQGMSFGPPQGPHDHYSGSPAPKTKGFQPVFNRSSSQDVRVVKTRATTPRSRGQVPPAYDVAVKPTIKSTYHQSIKDPLRFAENSLEPFHSVLTMPDQMAYLISSQIKNNKMISVPQLKRLEEYKLFQASDNLWDSAQIEPLVNEDGRILQLDGTLQWAQLPFTTVTNLNLPHFKTFMDENKYLCTRREHALKMSRKATMSHLSRPLKLRDIDVKWIEVNENYDLWLHRHIKVIMDVLNEEIKVTPTTVAVIQSLAKALKIQAIIHRHISDKWQSSQNRMLEDDLIRAYLTFLYEYPLGPEKEEDYNVHKRPPVLDFDKLKKKLGNWKGEKPKANLNLPTPNSKDPG